MAFRSKWVLCRWHNGFPLKQWFRAMTSMGPALTSKLHEAKVFVTSEEAYASPACKGDFFLVPQELKK